MYGNHPFVDIFNIAMLIILFACGFFYGTSLLKRYREKKVRPILIMALASYSVFLVSIILILMYLTNQLFSFSFLSLTGDSTYQVEPSSFFTSIALGFINFAMFEFRFLIFETPSKKNRNRVHISGIVAIAIISSVYLVLYNIAMSNSQYLIHPYAITMVVFFGNFIILALIYTLVLVQAYKVLQHMEKSDDSYVRIKYLSLWCFFGGIFFTMMMFIFTFKMFGIPFGIALIFAVIAAFCVYKAYIKR